MQRPGEKSKLDQSSCKLQNLKFSLSKFPDENNIAKWVAAMWGNYSNILCQSTFP